MLIALQVVEEAFGGFGLDTTITAGSDGLHKDGSLHYKGLALDFRTKDGAGLQKGIAQTVKARLEQAGYDVIFEGIGTENEHLHVEYDPKG